MTEDQSTPSNPFANLGSLPPSLPPPPFDVRLDLLKPTFAKMLWQLVEDGLLDGYICEGKKWIHGDDVQGYLAAGDCVDDPFSGAYIPRDAILDRSDPTCYAATAPRQDMPRESSHLPPTRILEPDGSSSPMSSHEALNRVVMANGDDR